MKHCQHGTCNTPTTQDADCVAMILAHCMSTPAYQMVCVQLPAQFCPSGCLQNGPYSGLSRDTTMTNTTPQLLHVSGSSSVGFCSTVHLEHPACPG